MALCGSGAPSPRNALQFASLAPRFDQSHSRRAYLRRRTIKDVSLRTGAVGEKAAAAAAEVVVEEEESVPELALEIKQLMEMGFSRDQARGANPNPHPHP